MIGINVNGMDAYKLDALPVLADAKLALEEIIPRLSGYRSAYAAGEIAAIKCEWDAEVDRLYSLSCSLPNRDEFNGGASNDNVLGQLLQSRILGLLRELLPKDAVVVCSGGSLPSDLERIWRQRNAGHLPLGIRLFVHGLRNTRSYRSPPSHRANIATARSMGLDR